MIQIKKTPLGIEAVRGFMQVGGQLCREFDEFENRLSWVKNGDLPMSKR